MCSESKKVCTLMTIKILAILLILNLVLTAIGIEYSPLYWIANFNYDSLPLVQGTELLNSNVEKWGIRGQIGDIMSGHFSALAVLAVAYSITLQVEANKKMTESIEKQEKALKHTEKTIAQQRESIEKQTEANLEQAQNTLQQAKAIELQAKSIEQQNEALKVQSKSLEIQIKELKASREESERQTQEFFIQNMNVKLDRYYKLLEKKIENRTHDPEYYSRVNKLKDTHKNIGKKTLIDFNRCEDELINIYNVIYFIYAEIENTSSISSTAYNNFKQEFILILNSEDFFYELKKHLTTFKESDISNLIKDKKADS